MNSSISCHERLRLLLLSSVLSKATRDKPGQWQSSKLLARYRGGVLLQMRIFPIFRDVRRIIQCWLLRKLHGSCGIIFVAAAVQVATRNNNQYLNQSMRGEKHRDRNVGILLSRKGNSRKSFPQLWVGEGGGVGDSETQQPQ